ncbi:MAG TPA: DMT family transporter [Actinomycetota bacterium]|nr:DMT family transporter [Actinomycetota bacterium]
MKPDRSTGRAANLRELAGGSFVALASLQFGAVVVLGRLMAERDLPVPAMLAVRFALAGGVLAAVLALSRMRLAAARRERLRLVLLGGVGYAAESALFFFALRHGTAAAITLLFFTYPVWVALLSAVMGMGLPGRLVIGSLVMTLAGAALVVASSEGLDVTPAGVGLALGSAVTFSLYLVGAERVVRDTSSPAAAMWVSLSAAGGLSLFALVSAQARLPSGANEWLPVGGMGILTAGAFFCLFAGLRRIGAVRTSIVASLEPVATALLALAFLGEPLGAGVMAGGLLILAAATTASVARRGLTEVETPTP